MSAAMGTTAARRRGCHPHSNAPRAVAPHMVLVSLPAFMDAIEVVFEQRENLTGAPAAYFYSDGAYLLTVCSFHACPFFPFY